MTTLLDPELSLNRFDALLRERMQALAENPQAKAGLVGELCGVLDFYLQDRWTQAAQPGQYMLALKNLRELFGPRGQGNAVLAQINTTPGDLSGNAKKIKRYLDAAEAVGADMVVFPELALMGYPIGDLIMRDAVVSETAQAGNLDPDSLVMQNILYLRELARHTRPGGTAALVGFVEPRIPEPGQRRVGKPFFNAVAVLADGEIQGVARKCLLPNYQVFDDYRTYEPSPAPGVHPPSTLCSASWGGDSPSSNGQPIIIHGRKVAISICEDIWNDKAPADAAPLYQRNPVEDLAASRSDVLVNVSASPTAMGKEGIKHNLLSQVAAKYGIPLLYANQVGGVDEIIFDGASRAYDENGQLIARARMFGEQFYPVSIGGQCAPIHNLPFGLEKPPAASSTFDSHDTRDLGRVYEGLLLGIRDYFAKTGYTQKALLGISGGLDSAVTATLLVDALGAQNVIGISMPSKITPDENRREAQQLADNLGIKLLTLPILEQVAAIEESLRVFKSDPEVVSLWGEPAAGAALENAQARARATILWTVANQHQAFTIATSDKSELYMGYTTINGDMTGALAPIADLPKTKVRALAHWLNAHRSVKDAIPRNMIEKPSGADLKLNPATGRPVTAEEELLPYPMLDEMIWRMEVLRQTRRQMLAEPFQYEETVFQQTGRRISAEEKRQMLDKAYRLMGLAVYKWHIAPPTLNIDGYGVVYRNYRHPIVTRWREYNAQSPEEIAQTLAEFGVMGRPAVNA